MVREWFDSKFPDGDSEREGLKEKAKRVKENALQNCRRAKRRPTSAEAELGKHCGVSGNKPTISWCFLGGFLSSIRCT